MEVGLRLLTMRQLSYSVKIFIIFSVLCFPINSYAQSSASAPPVSDVTVSSSASLVKAGNAFRDNLSCTVHSTTVNVRWGDSTITTTKGQRIPAGSSIEIKNRGPIYMISEGANVTVSCTEETR